nr:MULTISPECIES: 3'-5' exonuclease [Lysinibacillus]
MENIAKSLKFNKDYLMGIIYTLEEIAAPLKSMEDFAGRLKQLEEIMNASKFKKNENAVTLSTFHSSKGLEFKNVYLVDLMQGVIPSKDDVEDKHRSQLTDSLMISSNLISSIRLDNNCAGPTSKVRT